MAQHPLKLSLICHLNMKSLEYLVVHVSQILGTLTTRNSSLDQWNAPLLAIASIRKATGALILMENHKSRDAIFNETSFLLSKQLVFLFHLIPIIPPSAGPSLYSYPDNIDHEPSNDDYKNSSPISQQTEAPTQPQYTQICKLDLNAAYRS